MKRTFSAISISLLFAVSQIVHAESLEVVYQQAKEFNPGLTAQILNYKSSKMTVNKSLSALGPTVDLALGYTRTLKEPINNINGVSISAGIPIYSADIYHKIKMAKLANLQSKIELQHKKQALILETAEKYLDVSLKVNSVRANDNALKQFDTASKFESLKFKVGISTSVDTLRAEAERARQKVKKITTCNLLKQSRKNLQTITGKSYREFFYLDSNKAVLEDTIPTLSYWIKNAQKYNLEIMQATIQQRQAQLAYEQAIKSFLPTLSFFFSKKLDYQSMTDYEKRDLEYNLGIKADINLFRSFGDSLAVKEAYYKLLAANSKLSEVKKQVFAKISNEYNTFYSKVQEVEGLKTSLTASENALKSVKAFLDSGVVTAKEHLEAITNNVVAETELIDAIHKLYTHKINLKKEAGILKESDIKELDALLDQRVFLDDLNKTIYVQDYNILDCL